MYITSLVSPSIFEKTRRLSKGVIEIVKQLFHFISPLTDSSFWDVVNQLRVTGLYLKGERPYSIYNNNVYLKQYYISSQTFCHCQ